MKTSGLLDDLPMTRMQITVVVLCVLLNALDGFDVLAISFAAPGIVVEWAINRTELGIVLAMELAGMAAGSVLLGNVADRYGRRPVILGCLVVMSGGMFMAAFTGSIFSLLVVRFLTGVGIGGMLASTNAMVAEYSNARRRSLSVAMMAAGFPLGAIIGGSIASVLLAYFDWRAVFVLGGLMTAMLFPLVWYLMPESIYFLQSHRQSTALVKINATLKRMGHAAIDQLPELDLAEQKARWRDLFSPQLARTTFLLTTSYLTHIMTFYFILKWIPKIVVDMGFTASLAGGVLVWANVGGAAGALILGWLSQRIKVRLLVIIAMIGAVAMINVFGQGQASLGHLALIAGITGFFTNAGVVGLYALFAQHFPTHLRAGGTGFAIGVGRAGAVLGPIVAGMLFDAGSTLVTVSFVMALGSLVAAFLLFMLREQNTSESAAS